MIEKTFGSYPLHRVDWIDQVNMDRLRRGRLKKAKEQLFKERDLGAFLSLNEWNTRYITSTFTPLWTTGGSGLRYSLLPSTADQPILYEQGDIGYRTKIFAPWLGPENVKYAITGTGWISTCMGVAARDFQTKKFVKQITEDLKANRVEKEPLGVDFYDPITMKEFEKAGISVTLEGHAAMLDARKIKLPEEIECIRICCQIGDAMFEALRANLRPSVSEFKLQAKMMEACYSLGGRVVSGALITSGQTTWPNIRETCGRLISPGDVVYADVFNTEYLGYKTCYYRTFSLGKPSKETKEAYERALTWLYDSIKEIKPGATTKDVAEKWPPGPEIWGDIGVINEDMTAGNNWAHGIGLTLYEPPITWRAISLDYPMKYEKNMTMAIETQEGDKKGQGVRIEEVLRVTDGGVEILTKWPIDEITVVDI